MEYWFCLIAVTFYNRNHVLCRKNYVTCSRRFLKGDFLYIEHVDEGTILDKQQ